VSTTTTLTPEAILCLWAESKWTLPAPVGAVELDEQMEHDYSEDTPGNGWSLTVRVLDTDGNQMHVEHFDEAVPFVHEVARFAATLGGAG
jgi:hypothetical protein